MFRPESIIWNHQYNADFIHTRLCKSSASSRSVIFKRKRTESDNSLVSEGLREAISSYLQMTEGNSNSWEPWGKTVDQSERMNSDRDGRMVSCLTVLAHHRKRSSARPNGFAGRPGAAGELRHYNIWSFDKGLIPFLICTPSPIHCPLELSYRG